MHHFSGVSGTIVSQNFEALMKLQVGNVAYQISDSEQAIPYECCGYNMNTLRMCL